MKKKIGILVYWWTKGDGEPKNYGVYTYDPMYDKIINEICLVCRSTRCSWSQVEYSKIISKSSLRDVIGTLDALTNYAVCEHHLDSFFEDVDPEDTDVTYNFRGMLEEDDEFTVTNLENTKLAHWRVKSDKELIEEISELVDKIKSKESLETLKENLIHKIEEREKHDFLKLIYDDLSEFMDQHKITNGKIKNIVSSIKINRIHFTRTDHLVHACWEFSILHTMSIKVLQTGDYGSPKTHIGVKIGNHTYNLYDNESYAFDDVMVGMVLDTIHEKSKIERPYVESLNKVVVYFLEHTIINLCSYF